jgi:hypothetical protein
MNCGERTLAGSSPRAGLCERGESAQSPVQLVGAERYSFTDLCRLEVDRELTGQPGRQAPGSVVADKPGQRRQQRAVVVQWFGHLIVEALVVLALDAVGSETDSLADQYSGAGVAVVIGELGGGYGDREP